MSQPSITRCLLLVLVISICILLSYGKAVGVGRDTGVRKPSHSGLTDRVSYYRGTGQGGGVLGYYIWGSPPSWPSSKRGYSQEYPFLYSRRAKDSPAHLSQEELERMPKHYRRIVESGEHLEDFKQYYLSDMYKEDMDQVAAETRALIDRAE